MIAGTGRAGTTFLVQYLAACGLDTHLARHPDASTYNEDANAGLEDLPFDNPDLPYVIKSPWLHAYAARLLADPSIALDAVIFPMRSIVEASTSRVVNELRARYAMEGLPDDCRLWESWGTTPGGIVYSLNPIDEARLLALGFHELMHTLVKHDVPLVMLDFPRLVEDPAYLYDKLHPVLGAKLDRERALSAHRETAVPSKVRVGRSLLPTPRRRRPASNFLPRPPWTAWRSSVSWTRPCPSARCSSGNSTRQWLAALSSSANWTKPLPAARPASSI